MLIRRALLMTVAGASVFWILFGALVVPAAAAGTTRHLDGSAHSVSLNGSRDPGDDPGHHCHSGGSDDPGDGDRCCVEHCCEPAPPPRPTESPAPTPEPTASPAPTSHPKRAHSPAPHVPPPSAPVIAPRPIGVTPRERVAVSRRPTRSPRPASRPPVLAPSELTIPAVNSGERERPGGSGCGRGDRALDGPGCRDRCGRVPRADPPIRLRDDRCEGSDG